MKKHEYYQELVQLAVYDKLNEIEKNDLDNHLCECQECKEEFESITKLYTTVTQNIEPLPNDAVLIEARNELLAKITVENNRKPALVRFAEFLTSISTKRYFWLAPTLTALILGMLISPYFYSPQYDINKSVQDRQLTPNEILDKNIEISDIKFTSPFENGGEIVIDMNMFRPISIKGNYDDPAVKKLLAKALVTKGNPGLRLRTLNSISEQTAENNEMDPLVKTALITTIKKDENPGVRREALSLLLKYKYDYKVRNLMLYVLSNDKNPGLRIAAINALADHSAPDLEVDSIIKTVLQEKAANDNNNYVRLRAASILQEEK